MSAQTKIAERYVLRQHLGRDLHLAHDERTGAQVFARRVALPSELDERERAALAAEILREARAASRVRHPAVNTVLDAVLHDGTPWVVTARIPGRPLQEVVTQLGPLSPEATARVGADLLGALARAHLLGLVHGDVQPGNVWVTADGRGVLTGFGGGIAARSRRASSIGTPGFTAPEKTTGPAPAADLWSLGATLYFVVEGVPAFAGDGPMAVLSAVLSAEPRPPERAGALGPVLLELMAKDPARRPVAAAEDLEALARPAARDRRVPLRPGVLALLAACLAVSVASATTIATVLLTSPAASGAVPPADTEPGRFAAAPRACGLIGDEQARELVPDFVKSDQDGASGQAPGTHCRISAAGLDGTAVVTDLFALRPGPLGGGPATAREFLAGAREDASVAPADGDTVSAVRDLPGLGDQAIAYDAYRQSGSRYTARAVVIVSNLAAVVSCERRAPGAAGAQSPATELAACAEKAAGWVAAGLEQNP